MREQSCPVRIRDVVRAKRRIAERVASEIGSEGVKRASRDWHARRAPIPCGMTIHTGVGCSYGCAYCYIYDMGFTGKPKPYPLSGLELVYALAVNPYLVPGSWGTLLAFGSVTEPFMRETLDRALEYLEATKRFLGNPQQISTKTALRGRDLERFVEAADPRIDVLVSMATIKYWKRLEPGASSPVDRFEFMRQLSGRGFSVTLFMRPIIPGVTDREAETIISKAAEAGVKKVVPGTLRVTGNILKRLGATGVVDLRLIESRMPRSPRRPGEQVAIRGRDLKERIASLAREYGLDVYPASCSTNIVSHSQACHACRFGPCGDTRLLPRVSVEDIYEILDFAGLEPLKVWVEGGHVKVHARGSKLNAKLAYHLIIGLTRRTPIIVLN